MRYALCCVFKLMLYARSDDTHTPTRYCIIYMCCVCAHTWRKFDFRIGAGTSSKSRASIDDSSAEDLLCIVLACRNKFHRRRPPRACSSCLLWSQWIKPHTHSTHDDVRALACVNFDHCFIAQCNGYTQQPRPRFQSESSGVKIKSTIPPAWPPFSPGRIDGANCDCDCARACANFHRIARRRRR